MGAGEISNIMKVCVSVNISLTYCYFAGKIVCKGIPRLLTIIPIVCLFLTLPLNLTSVHFIGPVSFFISWLTNFKLLLFAIGKGPLSNPTLSLPLFLVHACFPIKLPKTPYPKSPLIIIHKDVFKNIPPPPPPLNSTTAHGKGSHTDSSDDPKSTTSKNSQKSLWNYGVKGLLLALFLNVHHYLKNSHPIFAWFFFGFATYFCLELMVALSSSLVGFLFGLELDPQFDEPFLATSLQDFWSRRWNIMATRILKPTVYDPALYISARLFGRKWAPLPAILSCFLVSGLMHELIFFYLGSNWPRWDMTRFFTIHGTCLVIEIAIKKAMNVNWCLPRVIAAPLVVTFVLVTSYWYFLPEMLRCQLDVRAFEDYAAVGVFAKEVARALTLRLSR